MTADDRRRLLIDHGAILSGLMNGLNMGHTPRHLRDHAQRAASAHRMAITAIRNDDPRASRRAKLAHALTRKVTGG